MSYMDDYDEKELYNRINRELGQPPRSEVLPLQGGYEDPVISPDISTETLPEVIPEAGVGEDIPPSLRDRLAKAYQLEGVLQGGSTLVEGLTGVKGGPVKAGSEILQGRIDDKAKLQERLAKGKNAAQTEKFSQYYVREGKHKGKPIYFQAGKGMFIRDGNKIVTEIDDQESFKNPYKPMVEKGEYQKGLDQRKQGFVEEVGRRPSDKQTENIANTAYIGEVLRDIRRLKTGVNTGPISSRVEGVKGFVADKDPKYVALEGVSGKFLADYLKTISGAAISELEMKRLKENVPHVGMNDEEFMIKLDNFEKIFTKGINKTIKAYRAQGKDINPLLELLSTFDEDTPESKEKVKRDIKKDAGKDPGPRPADPADVPAWRKQRIDYLKSRR